jgi:hypothetical protein
LLQISSSNAEGKLGRISHNVVEKKGMRISLLIAGAVSSAGALAGWFVMVKDNVGRFPGNKLWGEGWGWSWFDVTNPQKTTSTDYTTDCQSCAGDSQTGSTLAAIRS